MGAQSHRYTFSITDCCCIKLNEYPIIIIIIIITTTTIRLSPVVRRQKNAVNGQSSGGVIRQPSSSGGLHSAFQPHVTVIGMWSFLAHVRIIVTVPIIPTQNIKRDIPVNSAVGIKKQYSTQTITCRSMSGAYTDQYSI